MPLRLSWCCVRCGRLVLWRMDAAFGRFMRCLRMGFLFVSMVLVARFLWGYWMGFWNIDIDVSHRSFVLKKYTVKSPLLQGCHFSHLDFFAAAEKGVRLTFVTVCTIF